VQCFTGFLGSVAGNLALTLGAFGGVYLGGGIVPKLGSAFDIQRFRAAFEAKGRFATYLKDIPSFTIVSSTVALDGAAAYLESELRPY
jgi:glucokinase